MCWFTDSLSVRQLKKGSYFAFLPWASVLWGWPSRYLSIKEAWVPVTDGGMLGDEGVSRWPMILAHISAMSLSQRLGTRKDRLNVIVVRQNLGRYAWRCHWVLSQWTGQRFSEPKRKWFEGKGKPSGAGSTSEPSLTPMGRSKSVWCAATNAGSHDLRCKRTLMQTAGWKIKQTEMFRAIKRKASTSYHHANKT